MNQKVILCYGDSNTHGMTPIADALAPVRGRYGRDVRWPGVVQKLLDDAVAIIEEGLPGRTTCVDDPIKGAPKNGLTYLRPCLDSHFPIDIIVLMLGTNDLKAHFARSPEDITAGIETLLDGITEAQIGRDGKQPKILLVAPPPILEIGAEESAFKGGAEKSRHLAALYAAIAERRGLAFFDAGSVIEVSTVDGIHFEPEAHQRLGEALVQQLDSMMA
ncbi:SGNH/GDSL hydrolase family protein [Cardiobacteriaceae bacterium TAE3-ERU3]|nr:SGNH/GDSL hydrolase family protein [Cardiobacteriaceae bacterium TAE3-ERU3]